MAILDAQNMYGAQNDLFFCKVNYWKAYIKTYNEECPQSLKSFSNEEDFPSKNYNSLLDVYYFCQWGNVSKWNATRKWTFSQQPHNGSQTSCFPVLALVSISITKSERQSEEMFDITIIEEELRK